jgi:hypothetical protein
VNWLTGFIEKIMNDATSAEGQRLARRSSRRYREIIPVITVWVVDEAPYSSFFLCKLQQAPRSSKNASSSIWIIHKTSSESEHIGGKHKNWIDLEVRRR